MCPALILRIDCPVPRRARSKSRLRDHVVDAVIRSGRAVSETAASFAVSWWTVRAALSEAGVLTLPDVDELSPRMLAIDEHRFRSVRYFRAADSSSWIRHEPWMRPSWIWTPGTSWGSWTDGTTMASATGSSPSAGLAAGRAGRRDRPPAAFRKALRVWLPRTAVAVDHFHLVSLANQAVTEARQNLS